MVLNELRNIRRMGLERVPQLVDLLGDYTWEEIFSALDAIMANHAENARSDEDQEAFNKARGHLCTADYTIWEVS